MNSATTLPEAAPIRAPRLLGLYLLLIIIAAVEAFEGLSHAPMLFGDMSEIPGSGLGGAIIKVHIASLPCWRWRRWGLPPWAGCVTRSWRSARWC
jgi:hypothetical protein